MDASLDIVIVNFNTRDELRACLDSLEGSPHHILVFDNHSSDGSPEMVCKDYPHVMLIPNDRNLGYGAAANRAFQRCSSEAILLANSDVVFPPGAAEALVEYLEAHPKVAIAGPRLLNSDGTLQPSCFPFPGTLKWVVDNDVICLFLRYIPAAGGWLLRAWTHDRDRRVPWVKGAVLAIRRKAFIEVGGFAEDFFLYYEETDLCLRLAHRGWEIHFTPAASVVHHGGASTGKIRTETAVQLFVSSMQFARKHYTRAHGALLLIIWKIILLFRLLRDELRLWVCRGADRRLGVSADVAAWKRALAWTPRDLRTRGHG